MSAAAPSLHVLAPPYRRLTEAGDAPEAIGGLTDARGAALVWMMGARPDGEVFERVRCRPGGVPLIVILPPAGELDRADDALRVVEMCRPHGVLPWHERPDAGDLRTVLAQPPENLAVEVSEYLAWRGIVLDPDTRRIVRRIVELSSELRTVSGLARSLYLSRRALGRRFMKRGLPVPSHWLQACRLLRASIRLQDTDDNVFVVAAGLGYPDGFSLSNQMSRLIGIRPTRARERLGWEWIFESWLRKEARDGGFSREWAPLLVENGQGIGPDEDGVGDREPEENEEVRAAGTVGPSSRRRVRRPTIRRS